jgi:uncharacterized OsmC-like protein
MESVTVQLDQKGDTSSTLSFGAYQIIIDRPPGKGGRGEGPMGGQVLLMSVAGCFSSTLYAAAQARVMKIEGLKICVTGYISDDQPKRFEALNLEVVAGSCGDQREFSKLLKIAERGCIAVNTVKNGMKFQVTDHRVLSE